MSLNVLMAPTLMVYAADLSGVLGALKKCKATVRFFLRRPLGEAARGSLGCASCTENWNDLEDHRNRRYNLQMKYWFQYARRSLSSVAGAVEGNDARDRVNKWSRRLLPILELGTSSLVLPIRKKIIFLAACLGK